MLNVLTEILIVNAVAIFVLFLSRRMWVGLGVGYVGLLMILYPVVATVMQNTSPHWVHVGVVTVGTLLLLADVGRRVPKEHKQKHGDMTAGGAPNED